ncbi:MAG: ABC transporter permease [Trueperaceae bacterium]
MLTYTLQRLMSMVLVMAFVGVGIFVITRTIPGDPATILAGEDASPEAIERLRRIHGLDQPLPVQFGIWVREVVTGNLGKSLYFEQPVLRLLIDRAQPTIFLTIFALVLAILIGIPAGIVSAVSRGSVVDQGILGGAMVNAAIPSFLLGLVLMQYFAVERNWLPVAGYGPPDASILARAAYLILPAISLAIPNSALIARMTRGSMLDVLGEDYVRTARAKGAPAWSVFMKHALRNASINILTIVGVIAGSLLSGVVVIETVFALPGIGQLVMSAVLRRDYPTIQGALIVVAGVYVLINLAVDLLYAVVDPRIAR